MMMPTAHAATGATLIIQSEQVDLIRIAEHVSNRVTCPNSIELKRTYRLSDGTI